jgi:tetratricopeptide (TPR) repeat protein
MEVFVRLAQSPGAVVSKSALLESVWPDITVGEDALTRAISELRRALEDDARNPSFVETIPKRGYRLVAQLDRPAAKPAIGTPNRPRLAAVMAIVSVLAVTAALLWFLARDARHPVDGDATKEPLSLLMTDFEDKSGRGVGALVQRAVERELTQDGRLSLVPPQRVADVLARMRRTGDRVTTLDTALEIARRDGRIGAVITGRVDQRTDESVVSIQVTGRGGHSYRTFIARGNSERSLLTAAAREAAELREALSKFVPDPPGRLPVVTTSSLAALQYFDQSFDNVEATANTRHRPIAIELLQKALDEDPEFAMARIWLALKQRETDISQLSNFNEAPKATQLYYSNARTSLASVKDVSRQEGLFIEGAAYKLLEEHDRAVAALEALLWSTSGFFEMEARSFLVGLYAQLGQFVKADEQVMKLADLSPNDFYRTFGAAEVLVRREGNTHLAATYISKARQLLTPAAVQAHDWEAAWLELLPVFERWAATDIPGAVDTLRRLTTSMESRTGFERDALATNRGYFWLGLGRLADARQAFETVGHVSQRVWNLALMADLLDDRRELVELLGRHAWAYNPVPFARAGMFKRANEIMQAPKVGVVGKPQHAVARGEEFLAAKRYDKAIEELQRGFDLLRARPTSVFYTTAMSLARAWHESGDTSQEILILEDAIRTRPPYTSPGTPIAWWIKAQLQLVAAYDEASRTQDADALAGQIRQLLSQADPNHPFVETLAKRRHAQW